MANSNPYNLKNTKPIMTKNFKVYTRTSHEWSFADGAQTDDGRLRPFLISYNGNLSSGKDIYTQYATKMIQG